MRKQFDVKYRPHPEYRFWLNDPSGEGVTYYRTAAERDEAGQGSVAAYLDEEGWDNEVELISAGEVTHAAQVLNKTMRPPLEDLDEEGCDGDGTYWPAEIEWRGTYKLEPLAAAAAKGS